MTTFRVLLCVTLLPFSSASLFALDEISRDKATEEQLAFVREKVLPLLESRCFECHQNTKQRKGGLLLSSRQAMLTGGDSGPAIVPGKPNESLLVEAVRYESFEMPPRTKLPKEEVDILVKWIADGAVWPKNLDTASHAPADEFPLQQRKRSHWSWQPIKSPTSPAVTRPDWVRDSLDHFILKRIDEAGLTPANDADRPALIRRLYFDLVGLPPSVQQIETFVNDPAGDNEAIATVVDQLLASPHFGERWGRHWLDLVRYAETLGHEFDYPLHNAWRYRDYVIRAFNEDVAYDQFIREHVAGDLLASPRRHPQEQFNESIIGTGFWFLCEDKHAPVDVKGEEAAKIDNQIDVFSKTFLGMTVACARCHDHKFDAISTQDYYALSGFLQSSRRQTAYLDPGQKVAARVKQLAALRDEATAAIDSARSIDSGYLQQYILAAIDVIQGDPTEADKARLTEIVFEDFEQPTFEGWHVEGEAFASGTATGPFPGGQKEIRGFRGKRLVNSWRGNDGLTGKLVSSEFAIKKRFISLLVGGGAHAGKTCVNLVVNDKVQRTAVGRNREDMEITSWDVSEFVGNSARIEIVDYATGGWGHINVDHIVFSDTSSALKTQRSVEVVAQELGCQAALLEQWVATLLDKRHTATSDALSFPATMAQAEHGVDAGGINSAWARRTLQPQGKSETTPFADLSDGVPPGWFQLGHAFEQYPAEGNPSLTWADEGIRQQSNGGVSSAALSKELRGCLMSPTFELQHPEILVHVAGQGCKMRLVIDGYLMYEFNGLLFGGAKQNIDTEGEFRWLRFGGDIHRYQGHRMHIEFLDEGNGWFNVQEIRFANRRGAAPPADKASPLNSNLAEQLPVAGSVEANVKLWAQELAETQETAHATLLNNQLLPETPVEFATIVENWTTAASGIPGVIPVIAMTEGTPENERVFIRGNHRNMGGEAPRAILTALQNKEEHSNDGGSGRLRLAEQLVSNDNPLVARVAVNRIWHHLFGHGLVSSTDNLGVLGKRPTHPDLLDHLATRFRNDGWSVKRLIRAIALSRTYRMASTRSEKAQEIDPTNELFHRANIRRLQGESVRDAILAVSGRLDRTQFGSPVPIRLSSFLQGRGRPRANGPVDGNGRRSIYLSVNRNFLSPFMQAFDVPAPVTTTGARTVSNVPAQALIMLNNEFVNQQSRTWAEKLLAARPTSTDAVVRQAWRELIGRDPQADDIEPLLQFADAPDAVCSVETLTQVCHVLLNSKEFLFLQ